MKNVRKCYIVKINEKQFIGFIITYLTDNESRQDCKVYLNTSLKSLKDVKEKLTEFIHPLAVEKANPDFIVLWAEKIASNQNGIDQDTSMIPIDYSDYTEKQVQVIKFCHENIPVGEIYPYSKVAELAGLPKAQRFVGSTMRKSRVPFILPVQRVKSLKYLKKQHAVSRKMPL